MWFTLKLRKIRGWLKTEVRMVEVTTRTMELMMIKVLRKLTQRVI
jgi:hypothetical protein